MEKERKCKAGCLLSVLLSIVLTFSLIPIGAATVLAEGPAIKLGITADDGDYIYWIKEMTGFDGTGVKSVVIDYPKALSLHYDKTRLPGYNAGNAAAGWQITLTENVSATMNTATIVTTTAGVSANNIVSYLMSSSYTGARLWFKTANGAASASGTTISIKLNNSTLSKFIDAEGQEHYYEFVETPASSPNTWLEAYNLAYDKVLPGTGGTANETHGYLATITSIEEELFIFNSIAKLPGWLGGTRMLKGPSGSGTAKILNNSPLSGSTTYAALNVTYNESNYNIVSISGQASQWYWANGPDAGTVFYTRHAGSPGRNENFSFFSNSETLAVYPEYASIIHSSLEPNNAGGEYCLQFAQSSKATWNDLPYNNTSAIRGYYVEWTPAARLDPGTTTEIGAPILAAIPPVVFSPADLGYGAVSPRLITVQNFGGSELTDVEVNIDPESDFVIPDAQNHFTLSDKLAANSAKSFQIHPKLGLGVGTHTAVVSVKGMDGEKECETKFNVSFTVKDYALTASSNAGTVTLSPVGGRYAKGQSVKYSVVPSDSDNYYFDGWTAEGVSVTPGTISGGILTMPGIDVTLKANFLPRPTVVSLTIGTTDVNGNIIITFSEAMAAAKGSVSITGGAGTIAADKNAWLWSSGGRTLTVPYSGLAYGTAYTVTVGGSDFKNASGKGTLVPRSDSFTTKTQDSVLVSYNYLLPGSGGTLHSHSEAKRAAVAYDYAIDPTPGYHVASVELGDSTLSVTNPGGSAPWFDPSAGVNGTIMNIKPIAPDPLSVSINLEAANVTVMVKGRKIAEDGDILYSLPYSVEKGVPTQLENHMSGAVSPTWKLRPGEAAKLANKAYAEDETINLVYEPGTTTVTVHAYLYGSSQALVNDTLFPNIEIGSALTKPAPVVPGYKPVTNEGADWVGSAEKKIDSVSAADNVLTFYYKISEGNLTVIGKDVTSNAELYRDHINVPSNRVDFTVTPRAITHYYALTAAHIAFDGSAFSDSALNGGLNGAVLSGSTLTFSYVRKTEPITLIAVNASDDTPLEPSASYIVPGYQRVGENYTCTEADLAELDALVSDNTAGVRVSGPGSIPVSSGVNNVLIKYNVYSFDTVTVELYREESGLPTGPLIHSHQIRVATPGSGTVVVDPATIIFEGYEAIPSTEFGGSGMYSVTTSSTDPTKNVIKIPMLDNRRTVKIYEQIGTSSDVALISNTLYVSVAGKEIIPPHKSGYDVTEYKIFEWTETDPSLGAGDAITNDGMAMGSCVTLTDGAKNYSIVFKYESITDIIMATQSDVWIHTVLYGSGLSLATPFRISGAPIGRPFSYDAPVIEGYVLVDGGSGADLTAGSARMLDSVYSGDGNRLTFYYRLSAAPYAIMASAGSGGRISPSGAAVVVQGVPQTYTITADAGHHIVSVLVDGVDVGAISTYTFDNAIAGNHTIFAAFAEDILPPLPSYSITAYAAATGGRISPSGSVVVVQGVPLTYAITADAGHHIVSVFVDGVDVGAISTYTFDNVIAGNHTIFAAFSEDILPPLPSYSITAYAAATGGRISPGGITAVVQGVPQTYTITADARHHIVSVLADGVDVYADWQADQEQGQTVSGLMGQGQWQSESGLTGQGQGQSESGLSSQGQGQSESGLTGQEQVFTYTFDNAIAGNHTIFAAFAEDRTPTGAIEPTEPIEPVTATITATAGTGGAISNPGANTVTLGGSITFNITANSGYRINSVLVDNVNVGAVSSYTFNNVTTNHSITANFAADSGDDDGNGSGSGNGGGSSGNGNSSGNGDGSSNSNGSNSGNGGGISGNGSGSGSRSDLTRSVQTATKSAITLDPKVTGSAGETSAAAVTKKPWFKDVPQTAWFYEDVKYVTDKGLFKGTDDLTFSPYLPTTRGMLVTVLYRLAGEPDVNGSSPFSDVNGGSYYAAAVAWGSANGIVFGVGDNRFEPERSISRQELAVIIHRYMGFARISLDRVRDSKGFADSHTIGDWALNAVDELYIWGIVNGNNVNMFDPTGDAIRAHVAAMLHRLMEGAK